MINRLTVWLVALTLFAIPVRAQQLDIDPGERQKIEQVIQEYLISNPEVLELAFRELQRRRIDQQRLEMAKTADNYRDYLENNENAGVLGNPEGDVTIVEFFDYRCGYCRRHFSEVMRLVIEDGNIRWVARHFPILDRPEEAPLSRIAARAAIAANKQGKFKEFHIDMMTTPGEVSEELIFTIAKNVGLDIPKMKEDMVSALTEKQITNTLAIGQDIGFTGTPGYIIGKSVMLGAEGYDTLKRAVALARQSKKQ